MFTAILGTISLYAIPVMVLGILVYGTVKKVKVYEAFTDGAKDGFYIAVKIIPFLVGMLVAIGVFRASGAMQILTNAISPITKIIGLPGEVVPMTLMRSLSGGGTNGLMADLFKQFGPDSYIGKLASVLAGSTETTFYVLTVYFGSVGIKKTRHAITTGLMADFASIIASVVICRLLFG